MNYAYTIEYVPTEKFGNADGWFRFAEGPDQDFNQGMQQCMFLIDLQSGNLFALYNASLAKLPIKAVDITKGTAKDRTLSRVRQHVAEGWPTGVVELSLQSFYKQRSKLAELDECILCNAWKVIASKLRSSIIDLLREGHTKIKMLARSYLWWPGIDQEIKKETQQCKCCASTSNN